MIVNCHILKFIRHLVGTNRSREHTLHLTFHDLYSAYLKVDNVQMKCSTIIMSYDMQFNRFWVQNVSLNVMIPGRKIKIFGTEPKMASKIIVTLFRRLLYKLFSAISKSYCWIFSTTVFQNIFFSAKLVFKIDRKICPFELKNYWR